jgi:hypothetical protein
LLGVEDRHVAENGNVYIGGQFIELGVDARGAFGPPAPKPEGFFGTPGDSGIGMSVDHDGFGAGVDMPIDFFVPGSPEEVWVAGYRVSGAPTNFYAAARNGTRGIAEAKTVDESDGAVLRTRTVIVSQEADGVVLRLTMVHTLREDALFYTTHVVVENIGSVTADDVRYMRSFDPDNTVYQGGDYTTRNAILRTHEAGDHVAVVVADTSWNPSDPLFNSPLQTTSPTASPTSSSSRPVRTPRTRTARGGGGAAAAAADGESRPVDSNDTEAGRENNRRVDLIVVRR